MGRHAVGGGVADASRQHRQKPPNEPFSEVGGEAVPASRWQSEAGANGLGNVFAGETTEQWG